MVMIMHSSSFPPFDSHYLPSFSLLRTVEQAIMRNTSKTCMHNFARFSQLGQGRIHDSTPITLAKQ